MWTQPPGGFTYQQRRQRRRRRIEVALCAVTLMSMVSVLSYRWVTAVQPVGRSEAVHLFRAERQEPSFADDARNARPLPKLVHTPRKDLNAQASERHRDAPPRPETRSVVASADEQPNRTGARSRTGTRDRGEVPDAPEEGVYSWATDGYEQVGGARREFPAETQRIISAGVGRTWTQHHYFSEERQIWTAFQASSAGIQITEQRNKVTFGPVTSESKIDFRPPMLAAPRSVRVGLEWEGEWAGDTYGNYSSKIIEHTTMAIGGEQVEVWGMTYVIDLHGEQEGQVNAQVWFAPRHGLTVKEHYVQDVESDGAQYHAEWTQTLKSLHPRQ